MQRRKTEKEKQDRTIIDFFRFPYFFAAFRLCVEVYVKISALPLVSTVTPRAGTLERNETMLPSRHISVRIVSPG